MRQQQSHTDKDINNNCFICDIKKDECEKNGDNFHVHIEHEHNIWDYVNYMITLRLKDAQDLNATNSYAKERLEIKSIGWLPVHQSEKGENSSHEKEE